MRVDDALDLRAARAAHFEPHVGSDFAVVGTESALELVAVERYAAQPQAPRAEPFSLVFAGDAGIEQGLIGLRHEAVGRVELFIVPIGPGADGRHRYEAAFN
jgi:hypothetical protein